MAKQNRFRKRSSHKVTAFNIDRLLLSNVLCFLFSSYTHTMVYVRINLLTCGLNSLDYLVKPTITVKQIFDLVVSSLDLKNKKFFGLRAYHKKEQEWLWLKPSDTLHQAIQKGISWEPVICIDLRAKSIPNDFTMFKDDFAAMRLFYSQIRQHWNQGYSTKSAIELCLLAFYLLAETGPLTQVEQANEQTDFVYLVKQYLKTENDEQDQNIDLAVEQVLQVWKLLSSLSKDEAIYNYANLAMTTAECSNKQVYFPAKGYKQKDIQANVVVAKNGIKIQPQQDIMPASVQMDPIDLNWTSLRKVSRRSKRIILKLAIDNDSKNSIKKVRYQFTSKHMAKSVWQTIVTSHHEFLEKKFSDKSNCVDLIISNPNQFLQDIVANVSATNYFEPKEDDEALLTADKENNELETITSKLIQSSDENKLTQSQIAKTVDLILLMCEKIQQKLGLDDQSDGLQGNCSTVYDYQESIQQDKQTDECNNITCTTKQSVQEVSVYTNSHLT